MEPKFPVTEAIGKKLTIFLAGVLGVLLTGVADYVTGYEVRLFPLYFLPIAFVAWRLSRPYTLALSVLSSAIWAFSNFLAGRVYASPFTWPLNILSQLVAFGAVGILVSDLRRRLLLEEDLNRQDPLTSLLNSRAFNEHGDMLLAITRRWAKPFTIAYMDLDNFKEINDVRGHMEGDRALREAAGVLKNHFRSSDLVARLGGDEFAILLFDTGADAARLSLNRVRDLLVAIMSRNGWPVTVSVGAVSYVNAPQTLKEAIHLADSLMYQAKKQGKNRVCIEAIDPATGNP
jgi:diguanylate cyclase (GGDEF)-like protein